jgi:hypothetical protein
MRDHMDAIAVKVNEFISSEQRHLDADAAQLKLNRRSHSTPHTTLQRRSISRSDSKSDSIKSGHAETASSSSAAVTPSSDGRSPVPPLRKTTSAARATPASGDKGPSTARTTTPASSALPSSGTASSSAQSRRREDSRSHALSRSLSLPGAGAPRHGETRQPASDERRGSPRKRQRD